MCSTPYGIRGLAHGNVHKSLHEALVLNALRHQRFGTGLLAPTRQRLARAQRLTASEVWHRPG